MSVENGEWIMRGLAWDDPYRIRSPKELVNWIRSDSSQQCRLPMLSLLRADIVLTAIAFFNIPMKFFFGHNIPPYS